MLWHVSSTTGRKLHVISVIFHLFLKKQMQKRQRFISAWVVHLFSDGDIPTVLQISEGLWHVSFLSYHGIAYTCVNWLAPDMNWKRLQFGALEPPLSSPFLPWLITDLNRQAFCACVLYFMFMTTSARANPLCLLLAISCHAVQVWQLRLQGDNSFL